MIRWLVVFALMVPSASVFAQTTLVSTNSCIRGTQYPLECGKIELDRGHSRVLKLDRQFTSVIVGVPGIADATIQDLHTVVITAKEKDGKTNVMFLNAANEPIYAAEVIVTLQPKSAVLEHAPNGRVLIYASKKGLNNEYFPYACNSADCVALKREIQSELTDSTYAYATQPNQNNNNNNNFFPPGAGSAPSGGSDKTSDAGGGRSPE